MAKYPEILSNDGKRLAIMAAYRSYNDTGIEVDKSLPKYSSIKREVEDFKNNKTKATNRLSNMPSSMDVAVSDLQEALSEQEAIAQMAKEYNLIKDSDIHGVNLFVNKFLFNDIFSSYFSTATVNGESRPISPAVQEEEPKPWYKRLSELLHTKTKELDETYSLDVLQFFAQVKGITKKNMGLYTDRLSGYIVALKNSDMSGQSALKEQLLRDMVINKYESVLYATGNYYVITEEQVVDFVKKTERGVRLDYIKNYMRVIPPAVVKKIDKANKLEIFDNYVILHYDPDEKSYAQTIEEKKKEEAKRRDPILFGLIRGSNKLYYITDWVDEYCYLTLDKFVETLQVDKKSLKMDKTII